MNEESKCRREHIPEYVNDYTTAEQFDVYIQRRQQQIEWLNELISIAIAKKKEIAKFVKIGD